MRQSLTNGLILRAVETEEDIAKLGVFNEAVHELQGLAPLVRDLCSPRHPTMTHDDFWLIEEPTSGEFAASLCLIPQMWSYEGVPFPVARMELVGTAEKYRQQGLFRTLNEVFNTRTIELGINVQVITGIEYFYRLMGYEYALDLTGTRHMAFSLLPETPTDTPYQLRRAVLSDIPYLMGVYQRYTKRFAVTQVRNEAEWRYRVSDHDPSNIGVPRYYVIEKGDRLVGYVSISLDTWDKEWLIDEWVTTESAINLVPWLLPTLRDLGLEANTQEGRSANRLALRLGPEHEIYDHLLPYYPYAHPAYAWYIRVLDVHAFLQTIQPVLERRIAESALRGLTKAFTLRLYTQNITFQFEGGRITALEKQPRSLDDGHLSMPPNVFHQLLFGYRSFAEINHIYPDAAVDRWARPLVDVLFPKRRSWATPLN